MVQCRHGCIRGRGMIIMLWYSVIIMMMMVLPHASCCNGLGIQECAWGRACGAGDGLGRLLQ